MHYLGLTLTVQRDSCFDEYGYFCVIYPDPYCDGQKVDFFNLYPDSMKDVEDEAEAGRLAFERLKSEYGGFGRFLDDATLYIDKAVRDPGNDVHNATRSSWDRLNEAREPSKIISANDLIRLSQSEGFVPEDWVVVIADPVYT